MGNPIADELIKKTYAELAKPDRPKASSRVWKSSNGYMYLVPWSNASLLRIFVRKFTLSLPKAEFRLKTQLDDAARSVIANIEEGFARPTTREYLDYLGFSQASLKEVKGDVQRSRQDGYLRSVLGSTLASLRIDLKVWHEKLNASTRTRPVEVKGNYRNVEEYKGNDQTEKNPHIPFKFLYPPVDGLTGVDLTYEIFIELINKTEWHLERLVISLENKLGQEQKYYQVQQARLRERLKPQR